MAEIIKVAKDLVAIIDRDENGRIIRKQLLTNDEVYKSLAIQKQAIGQMEAAMVKFDPSKNYGEIKEVVK